MISHHAMLGDPGELHVVMLVGEMRLVGAITPYSIEALEVSFVGRHVGG